MLFSMRTSREFMQKNITEDKKKPLERGNVFAFQQLKRLPNPDDFSYDNVFVPIEWKRLGRILLIV